MSLISRCLPTRALGLLMAIGFADLLATSLLYSSGLIDELNPLMRPVLHHSLWAFGFLKGGTLLLGWWALANYARSDRSFVRRICLFGSVAYVIIWVGWLIVGR
ncbi:MAG: hypothetical protein HYR64_07840 [Fimbriimonas ginsengisoli]|uniref:DUF5658 domain-containing protein n=1 Tax=Fimbriimonas ginsengisoli TaxID=1005039 RepID=A0A931M143_FIMGI|nr:hypothetical protein [Fimbriimonas ginsengisoli]